MADEIAVIHDGRGSLDALTTASHVHNQDGECIKRRDGERC